MATVECVNLGIVVVVVAARRGGLQFVRIGFVVLADAALLIVHSTPSWRMPSERRRRG